VKAGQRVATSQPVPDKRDRGYRVLGPAQLPRNAVASPLRPLKPAGLRTVGSCATTGAPVGKAPASLRPPGAHEQVWSCRTVTYTGRPTHEEHKVCGVCFRGVRSRTDCARAPDQRVQRAGAKPAAEGALA
jgi:hypothetical protein